MSYHTSIRAVSIAMLFFPVSADFLFGGIPGAPWPVLCVSAFAACCILVCSPVASQGRNEALIPVAAIVVLNCVCSATGLGFVPAAACSTAGVLLHVLLAALDKYRRPRLLFGPDAVWSAVEEYAKLAHIAFILPVGLLASVFAGASGTLRWIPACILACIYAAQYVRTYTGLTLVMTRTSEDKIKDLARIIAGNRLSTEDESELVRMKSVYARCVKLMNEKKPFLDPDMGLDDLASLVYCNRSYLSRSINTFSGVNFRQFVNRCRIDYAQTLIDKDPHLKVSELSTMCGFNTPVSFTMAFKLNTGVVPSDYIRDKAFSLK